MKVLNQPFNNSVSDIFLYQVGFYLEQSVEQPFINFD